MLVTCPECSHKVSEKADICPQCGFDWPVHSSEEYVKRGVQEYVIGKTRGYTCEKHWFSKPQLLISVVKAAKHKDGCSEIGWYLSISEECPSCGERTFRGCERCKS